ncbi:MAG: ATP-binding cassette domain-containing protein [Chitinispirillales bacterium]|jgi:molybdate transport system ATP-binding protein|nr:ATP-binding cassette domain-containing protein [Chitinispirillales bacterium]
MKTDKILFLCQDLTIVNRKSCLKIPNFLLKRGETWVILGQNGAGKSQFAQILGGKKIDFCGKVKSFGRSVLVSFEKINETIENDRQDDAYISESNFLSPGQKVCDFFKISNLRILDEFMQKFNIFHTRNTSIRHLSTGELAKILIIAALCENPDILVLDEPFDGLDTKSCGELLQIIENFIDKKVAVIMFLNRIQEIPACASHLAFIEKERSFLVAGKREIVEKSKKFQRLLHFQNEKIQEIPQKITQDSPILYENYAVLKNVCIKYGEKIVLDNLNWTLKRGEHWYIFGPNGCGKSTLLSIISGDNPQSFANDIELFGKKRGQGETIWEIKKNVGIVSTLFHRDYRVSISALNVIISGFHDTIGIYKKPSLSEIHAANRWLELAAMKNAAKESFANLSYGEQRLLLILRAMVKHPPILILDEPCFGLDPFNRELVLNLVEILASSNTTSVLFVSHHEEDVIKNIKNRLEFVQSKNGYDIIEKRIN